MMVRIWRAVPLLAAALLVPIAIGTNATSAATVANPSGIWHAPQIVIHDLAPVNGDGAHLTAISCASAGDCSAVGQFKGTLTVGGTATDEGIVATETNGTWGAAHEITNDDDGAYNFKAIDCASPGNCVAVGDAGNFGFVAAQVDGTWGSPQVLVGTLSSQADLSAVSCPSAGDCTVAGSSDSAAAVVTESNGTWAAPQTPAGTANTDAGFTSISCVSVGNCSAGGYFDSDVLPGVGFPLVGTETAGTWGDVKPLSGPFTTNLNLDVSLVTTISCSSPGDCGAGGSYGAFDAAQHGFVTSETNGTWATVTDTDGTLGVGGSVIHSIDCRTKGNCSAVGEYVDKSADTRGLVVNEINGAWTAGQQVAAKLNLEFAQLFSVSCASAGNCSAAGYYTNENEGFNGLVVTETKGVWGSGQDIANPGAADGEAEAKSISCPAIGSCGVAGELYDAADTDEAFVSRETPATVPGPPTHVTAKAGDKKARVSWTAPTNNGGSPITGYIVTSKPGGKTCKTTTATSCTVKGLTNGTSYTFSVVATNALGNSTPGVSHSAVPKGAPSAPTKPAVTGKKTSATVTWKPPASDNGAKISGYDVYLGTKSGTESSTPVNVKLLGATKRSYTVKGLKKSTHYYFVIRAKNSVGLGAVSKQVSAVA